MATVRQGVGQHAAIDARREVFPGLVTFIVGGGVAAAAIAASIILGKTVAHGGPIIQVALCAVLGTITGLFLGLGRGVVWHRSQPERPTESHAPTDILWDPWVDTGDDLDAGGPPSSAMTTAIIQEAPEDRIEVAPRFIAARAHVRPRVRSPISGDVILLEDEIGRVLQAEERGFVFLAGSPGSGKSTALRHLAAILPPWALDRVRMIDDSDGGDEIALLGDRGCQLVISAWRRLKAQPRETTYNLTAWSQDDIIEYLLSAHPDRCASVMARLKAASDPDFLDGIPELWTCALDRMACDDSVSDVRVALERELAAYFDQSPGAREVAENFCLTCLGRRSGEVSSLPSWALPGEASNQVRWAEKANRLIRHRPVTLLLAASRVVAIAERGSVDLEFTHPFPRDLVLEAARRIAGNVPALDHLLDWVHQRSHEAIHPMAASLLLAARPDWKPGPDCPPRLNGAYLAGAAWSHTNLARADLESADLEDADLVQANLAHAQATSTRLARAYLRNATLDCWVAYLADLTEADLDSVHAVNASFRHANLTGARLSRANLWRASFEDAEIKGADFRGAILEDACLRGLDLRLARFDGARFGGADLRDANIERINLTAADFHDADLRDATLTGSRMYGACFLGADLRRARLADIDWPDSDLRDTDLRGASFHLGSVRDGLVGSPIACEGSRTGFYTDDDRDRDFKPIAEVRKANLRGADLRGANIEGVDFYLVDLRDAKYTRDQASHLQRCRAILEDRE